MIKIPRNHFLKMLTLYGLGRPFLNESTLDTSDLHSNPVMDLVLLAERSRKIFDFKQRSKLQLFTVANLHH